MKTLGVVVVNPGALSRRKKGGINERGLNGTKGNGFKTVKRDGGIVCMRGRSFDHKHYIFDTNAKGISFIVARFVGDCHAREQRIRMRSQTVRDSLRTFVNVQKGPQGIS